MSRPALVARRRAAQTPASARGSLERPLFLLGTVCGPTRSAWRTDAAHAGAHVRKLLAGAEVSMTSRILSFTLAAACMAVAGKAHAYDPSDPRGPSPDDPSAWGHIGEHAAAPAASAPEPCSSVVADMSVHRSVRALDCGCASAQALPAARVEDVASRPGARGDAVESSW